MAFTDRDTATRVTIGDLVTETRAAYIRRKGIRVERRQTRQIVFRVPQEDGAWSLEPPMW